MNLFKYVSIPTVLLSLIYVGAASASPNIPVVDANVEVVEKVGRSHAEYFYSPIIGINYRDIIQIDTNFIENIDNEFNLNNNSIAADRTELGGVIGLLVDGQYQIVSTSYWRAGFQTGLLYTSPVKTDFVLAKQRCLNAPLCIESGSLKTSEVEVPMLFTMSAYAAADKYITTFKFGPVITYQMYDLDFEDYKPVTTNETQILLQLGLDGRYRLGKSDNFFLMGFVGTFGGILGGGDEQFSGVNTGDNISVYIGISFS